MSRTGRNLSVAVLLLMVAQAALGRAISDAYADPEWIEATWIGNDWLTLLVAAPLLSIALVRARQSTSARILALSVLAYAIYNYCFYLFGARINVFFPLYVAAVLLATAALTAELVQALAGPSRPRAPA